MASIAYLTETVAALDVRLDLLRAAMVEAKQALKERNHNGVIGGLLMAQDQITPMSKIVDAGILMGHQRH